MLLLLLCLDQDQEGIRASHWVPLTLSEALPGTWIWGPEAARCSSVSFPCTLLSPSACGLVQGQEKQPEVSSYSFQGHWVGVVPLTQASNRRCKQIGIVTRNSLRTVLSFDWQEAQHSRSGLEKGDRKPPPWTQGPCWHQFLEHSATPSAPSPPHLPAGNPSVAL